MKKDYSAQLWTFVIVFTVGAIFKTIADNRVAVAHEAMQEDTHRIAEAQDRAYPPKKIDAYRSSTCSQPWLVPHTVIKIRSKS